MKAPFPWFGGKSRVAKEVWTAFGDVANFVEPFFGSGAVLLARPAAHTGRIETINDKDGFVSNFWRAVQSDPEAVAEYADWPVSENDLHARHVWLVNQGADLVARLEGDPDYYDPKVAGWWVWGLCAWIGSGWCAGNGPWKTIDGALVNTGDPGGVRRKLPHLGNAGQGINRMRGPLADMMRALSDRLRHVRICSGDWSRVCGPSVTERHGLTGVFLDPPYGVDDRDGELYRIEGSTTNVVREWAIEQGANPLMRIALCGYDREHTMPDSWMVFRWKASGGFGSQGGESSRGRANAGRETIWFSPNCLPIGERQANLFAGLAAS